jgi:cardiolipin synthase
MHTVRSDRFARPPLTPTSALPRRAPVEEAPLPPAQAPQSLSVAGHDVTVFVESPPLFDAIAADMHAARRRIWVESYIFYNDNGGTRIADILKSKAKSGLDVRVMYDAVGSASTPNAFFTEMEDAGVKVHAFHSLLEGLRRFRPFTILNRRNHRKLIVIDDVSAYFGGMNLIDNVEDVEQQKEEARPTSSGWRDVHLRLAGPQQAELAESFERSWARARGLHVPRRSRRQRRQRLLQAADELATDESIRFFDSGPRDRYSRAARVYARLIRRAHNQITLSMAYFIPVGGILRALLAARRRRVGIRVIVPGRSDVKLVQYASAYLYDRLLRRGFRVYERQHRMLHSKVMIIDDMYTLVGSANLDPRSLYTNLEFIAVIRSQALARIMHRICRFEISQSERITLPSCRRISRWQRIRNRFAWMLRWWL